MPIEIVLLSLKKSKWKEKKTIQKNKTNKQQQNKQKQQLHVIAPVYVTDEDAIK